MIRVENLTMGWGDRPLMANLDFEVAEGEIFGVLGGSGSGKSTLLRCLTGLAAPMAGQVTIKGIGEPRLEARLPDFGFMFQGGALLGSMTLFENCALALRSWTDLDEAPIDAIVRAKLKLVGLGGFENHLPAELSGGMRKRAAIARALVLEPHLVFFDEPSAGLDPISAVELDDLILTLNRSLGTTIVVVTHELESIFKIVGSCIMLDTATKGIIARGDPRKLRDESTVPFVRSFFNRLPEHA
jgi:phospholipid/cholesterol/gamma-HCH transport system ATP-binding protein